MLPALRRVSDRLSTEMNAWLGVRENLGFKVISYMKPETLEVHFGTDASVTQVAPRGISEKILEAIQKHRNISTIFVRDPKVSEHVAYVITIDLDRGRVDRERSSWQLLEDRWGWRRGLPQKEDVPTYEGRDYHVSLFDFLHAFAMLAVDPLQQQYRRAFLTRQARITKGFGHSQRFESLISCLASQLDPETCVLFMRAMHELWKHEEHMNRSVSFEEAQEVLSSARIEAQEYDHNNQFWEMHDFGPEVAGRSWFNDMGDRIASATVYGDGANPASGKTEIRVWVYRSLFVQEQARVLMKCFASKK